MDTNNHKNHHTGLPKWAKPPVINCLQRLRDESRFLHLSMRGLGQITLLPEIIKVLAEVDMEMDDEESSHVTKDIQYAERDADWVDQEISKGFPILHSHSVVGIWSTLEVFSEDMVVTWLENRPDAWEREEMKKLKVEVSIYRSLEGRQSTRFIIQELNRVHGAGLSSGVTKFTSLLSIFNLSPKVGDQVRKALHELCQIRNVIVHSGGKADQKLINECPWLGLEVGESLSIPHPVYAWYYAAAERFVERVFNQVFINFGLTGCTCPGMDNIHERPSEDDIREYLEQLANQQG